MILVTVTRFPPSWVAIDPQKFSAATTRSGLAGGASVGVAGTLVAVGGTLAAVGATLLAVCETLVEVDDTAVAVTGTAVGGDGAVVDDGATTAEVGLGDGPPQATVSNITLARSMWPRTSTGDGRRVTRLIGSKDTASTPKCD
jgi:hypothetical protein